MDDLNELANACACSISKFIEKAPTLSILVRLFILMDIIQSVSTEPKSIRLILSESASKAMKTDWIDAKVLKVGD